MNAPQAISPTDHLNRIVQSFADFRTIAAAIPADTAIPSCPDWTMHDLLKHMSDVAQFWSGVIDARGEVPAPGSGRDRGSDLFELYDSAVAGLCDRLSSAPDPSPIWTWLGKRKVSPWLLRRLDAETSLHLWDACSSTPDGAVPLDPTFACDAVDEYFDTITFTKSPPVSLHLHATDADGEWSISTDDDGERVVTHEHVKADVAVRGTASDVLLMLWGRKAAAELEVFGDANIVDTWLKPV